MAHPKLPFLNDLVQAITSSDRRARQSRVADEKAVLKALARPAFERLSAMC